MHFTYAEEINRRELMQGDVLERTPAIDILLKQVHPHFHDHPKNLYFMVLTQSCDLVVRTPDGRCKAPYISIAPVRALDLVVERHIALADAANVKAELPVVTDKVKSKATEFLTRLLNNNEPGYFFLEGQDTLGSDCAAFLKLSIAIKSDLHLDTCLGAKILQLRAEFQAKLGWLVGQLFSRVGTQDWEPSALSRKVKAVLKDAAIWVPDATIAHIESEFSKQLSGNPNAKMTAPEISRAVSTAPKKKDAVIEQTAKIIADFLGQDRKDEIAKLRKRLESDSALTALLR